ncbi:hypothetical protein [Maritimibacter dapengensis]|uniref:Uncharacterized protein n=1 Tax=Maritimibacter dapengensis TaxID=2836868 RepID=A0ABS6SWH4_9RHOB|nr:hypothetical protein [Maritimibacter dapengensis]MBV7377316.1 hypothetical protein [Maritimibacter dapengensis]
MNDDAKSFSEQLLTGARSVMRSVFRDTVEFVAVIVVLAALAVTGLSVWLGIPLVAGAALFLVIGAVGLIVSIFTS